MAWNVTLSNTQLLSTITVFALPILIWGVSVETRFSEPHENSRAIKEIRTEVRQNTEYIVKINDKIDQKATKDNANFLLILKAVYDLRVDLKDKKDRKK
jgi:chromatin remodeling complex protein RSC6